MKKALRLLQNKFILASTIFFVYTLFLDDNDIFNIIGQRRKLSALRTEKAQFEKELNQTRITLKKLENRTEVEKFAREEKLFKKDDEDVFVIFYE
ncbi:MAG: septum formation initiator [Fluviicola sp. XM-24bin1]|nr:MAG: septum formation initiator [Fluviicola sp. XM-24bin1]